MSRPLRVWCGNYDGRNKRMVATTTKKDAAQKIGVSLYMFSQFFCATGNKDDIAKAMESPGTVYAKPYANFGGDGWQPVRPSASPCTAPSSADPTRTRRL